MKVHVIGIGPGNPELLTVAAHTAIAESHLLIGAKRMLDAIESNAEKVIAITPEETQNVLERFEERVEIAAILVSGDVGFFSAALGLYDLPFSIQLHCGISSLQYLCAAVKTSWEDIKTLSLHGRTGDLVQFVRRNAKIFVLTDREYPPNRLCEMLCKAGLGKVQVTVGENLSYPDEKITQASAQELAGRIFSPLNSMLIYNTAPISHAVTHGLPDDVFIRGETPMSKEEVRVLSIARLRLQQRMCVWDVGAGTGSVAIEIARVMEDGVVYAVERDAQAVELLQKNRERFSFNHLKIIEGEAPQALIELPAPDAIFIGGSTGNMREILMLAVEKNAEVRVVINAILPETAVEAAAEMHRLNLQNFQMVQLSAAHARKVGQGHMMLGNNPIYILSAGGKAQND